MYRTNAKPMRVIVRLNGEELAEAIREYAAVNKDVEIAEDVKVLHVSVNGTKFDAKPNGTLVSAEFEL